METKVSEIEGGIFRLSTYVPQIAPPEGFTFNQFLILGDEPMLFHAGLRKMFPLVSTAVAKIIDVASLRWISFGHYEADECGAMNEWLTVAPHAEIAHGVTGCLVSLNDMADRAPRVMMNDEVLDIGGKQIRYIDTPHVPHGWDAGVIYEENSGTLFCGDLFTHLGDGIPLVNTDIVGPALAAENIFYDTSLGPSIAPTVRKLAALAPRTLALMHGSSFNGDAVNALHNLADAYDLRLREAMK